MGWRRLRDAGPVGARMRRPRVAAPGDNHAPSACTPTDRWRRSCTASAIVAAAVLAGVPFARAGRAR